MKIVAVCIAAVALVAGCSTRGGTTAPATVPTTIAAPSSSTPAIVATPTGAALTATQLAQKAGCTGVRPAKKLLARTAATCALSGVTIQVATFHNAASRDQFLELGKAVVPGAANRVGDLWVATQAEGNTDALIPFGGTEA